MLVQKLTVFSLHRHNYPRIWVERHERERSEVVMGLGLRRMVARGSALLPQPE